MTIAVFEIRNIGATIRGYLMPSMESRVVLLIKNKDKEFLMHEFEAPERPFQSGIGNSMLF
jgi:hypothetical protein